MFSDDFTVSRDSGGAVFIDRSGEHFNFILDYLCGNIVDLDDIFFDENTRKMLIKEADYYKLEGMRNILTFKSNLVQKKDDCKAEIIEIVENVIQNKEAIRNFLDESKNHERNVPSEAKLASITDLQLRSFFDGFQSNDCHKTTRSMAFTNKRWDGEDFARVIFSHSVSFKQCSFVNANFDHCQFNSKAIVSFHQCDLINTNFTSAHFYGGKIQFDESDIRSATFNNIKLKHIEDGTITFNKVKYVDTADFGNEAINAVIKLMNKIN